jgi:hypothetical protein
VITVAILASLAFSLLSSSGVFGRMRAAVKSDNYTVNQNMMSYFFYVTYQNFQTNQKSYMDYFSLDTSKSLKDQPFGGDPADTSKTYYDTYMLGSFEGTWFDYFMEQTKNEVSSMLVYLEEADARGITLSDEEIDEIEEYGQYKFEEGTMFTRPVDGTYKTYDEQGTLVHVERRLYTFYEDGTRKSTEFIVSNPDGQVIDTYVEQYDEQGKLTSTTQS